MYLYTLCFLKLQSKKRKLRKKERGSCNDLLRIHGNRRAKAKFPQSKLAFSRSKGGNSFTLRPLHMVAEISIMII